MPPPSGQQDIQGVDEDQNPEDVEIENDVDDETMSGKNKLFLFCSFVSIFMVEIYFTGDNDVFNHPALLSELDSLTEPPSLESMTRSVTKQNFECFVEKTLCFSDLQYFMLADHPHFQEGASLF